MSPFPKLEQQQQNTVILPIGYLHHQSSPPHPLPPQKTKTHPIKTLTKQHCATASHAFSCALLGKTRHYCNKHTHIQTKFVFFPQGKNQTPKL
jgi:hypothetical protein